METVRLVIRPFQEKDWVALFDYLSNPAVYRFEPGEPITAAEAKDLALERSQGNDFLAVALKSSDKMIGHLYFSQVDPPEWMTWELGYIFNPAFQRQGYATEASAALVRYAFEKLDAHRIVAHCNPENVASWRVMEKIGMRREGLMLKSVFFRRDAGGAPLWMDAFEYAMLREDLK
ncbi:MAG: GNAT family N-acetyltransferase [Anaerolineae bacterium]|nr:GNAT family N-acetyltransferase [Anaerolineae bacterium]